MIISSFYKRNLSQAGDRARILFSVRVDAAMPETGSQIGKTIIRLGGSIVGDLVETLVGRRRIQRTEMLYIRPDLHVVECHVKSPFDIPATRLQRRGQPY